MLVAKADVPPYDERLRGYFENKAVHIRHMAALGVAFAVHPSAFVVHLPHPPSAARQWIIDPANQATRDLIQVGLHCAAAPAPPFGLRWSFAAMTICDCHQIRCASVQHETPPCL